MSGLLALLYKLWHILTILPFILVKYIYGEILFNDGFPNKD